MFARPVGETERVLTDIKTKPAQAGKQARGMEMLVWVGRFVSTEYDFIGLGLVSGYGCRLLPVLV